MTRSARIFVAGHRGLVGAALLRRLEAEGATNVLVADRQTLDLRDASAVLAWCERERPEYVLMAAGTVGGIMANATRPAEFIYDNLAMQTAVLHAAWRTGVTKILLLGSSCVYPRDCAQPIREESLLTGPLEPTNAPYALAKISALQMGQAYQAQYGLRVVAAMPSNLYGPEDNFDLQSGHVLPALIHRFHRAKLEGVRTLTFWGTGAPLREFLHVDDLATACLRLMDVHESPAPINVGTGEAITIRALADLVRDVVYPEATVLFDGVHPDGCPRKVLDVSRMRALGWQHRVDLRDGIAQTYRWFCARLASGLPPRGVRTDA